jgi:hypothetical protein
MSSRPTKRSDNDTLYAPLVISATVDVWNEYGKAAMVHANCARVGKETAGRNGKFNGGHWIYTGNTTSFLQYIPHMPRCADYADVAATLEAAQSFAATLDADVPATLDAAQSLAATFDAAQPLAPTAAAAARGCSTARRG